jgi:predicted nucleic acid-binding protein
MIVVDTNVMMHLLTGSGPGDRAAHLLAEDPEWAAPPILLSELRNVVLGFLRSDRVRRADAVEICEDAQEILRHRIATVPSPQVLDAAVECGLSAYDAEFVVLARRLGVPLVTTDEAILAGAPDVAVAL